jgi:DivIVA domain-containing protein
MGLTADDVHNVAFRKAALGRRGYDEEEVDAFLNQVEATIAGLQAEVARLGGGSGQTVSQAPDVLTELEQIKQRLARIEAAVGARPAF